MADLELKSVERVYGGGFKAVHGINLKVEDGEFMVLVGPSGCAKSTTLRMIAGLETITGGEIRIGENVVNDLVPGKRGIAMVFQNYALYPHMKVRRNLSFGLKLKRETAERIESATTEVSGILEIEELLDRLPKQLSGGQAQRVAVGRALIKSPEVFLFDEPLSNLDAKLRASMRIRITDLHKRLRDEGRPATVVYVTHDLVEAMTMGDRICVMKDGHIMQVADPVTLYERPANAFVAGFIGMPEMNLAPAELVSGGKTQITLAGQKIVLDDSLIARLTRSQGPVTFGIRPQHMELVPAGSDNALTGTVHNIEFMGHEVNLHVTIGVSNFIAVIPTTGLINTSNEGTKPRCAQTARAYFFSIAITEAMSRSERPRNKRHREVIITHFKTIIAVALATTAMGNIASADELRMSWWGGDSRHVATQAALEVCGAKHGHTIKPEFTGWSGHFEKVATQLAGGTEADIMQINWPWLPIFSKKGDGFADLNGLSDIIDLDQWPAELREASSRSGMLNGLPASLSGRIFFFNKTTFDKAGIAIPTTMEELMAAGPVFKEKLGDDYFPMEGTGLDASLLIQMVVTQRTGKSLINPDTNQVQWTVDDIQAGIDYYQALVDNHVIQAWKDKAAAGNVALHENANWTSGKSAGAYQWDTTYFKISDPLEDGQELVPSGLLRVEGASNDGVYRKPSMVFAISANSENKEAAAQILNCLTTEADGIAAMSSARGVPSSAVAAAQLLSDGGVKQIQVDAQNMVLAAQAPAISPFNEDPDVRAGIEDTLELFAYGELDSAEAAAEMLMLVNEALEDK